METFYSVEFLHNVKAWLAGHVVQIPEIYNNCFLLAALTKTTGIERKEAQSSQMKMIMAQIQIS